MVVIVFRQAGARKDGSRYPLILSCNLDNIRLDADIFTQG
jgi:hypothetical protein